MVKITATTPAMECQKYDDERLFVVGHEYWCCTEELQKLFKQPRLRKGSFVRLVFSSEVMPNSCRIRLQKREECSLRWTAAPRAVPWGFILHPLRYWLGEQFPDLADGRIGKLYVQLLPGKRGGKPYPVRKD